MTAIEVDALGLTKGPFVPIEPNPLHSLENGLDGFIGRAALVRVFDTEDKHALLLAGKEPIEQRRADPSNMEKAGRTGRESYSYLSHRILTDVIRKGRYLYHAGKSLVQETPRFHLVVASAMRKKEIVMAELTQAAAVLSVNDLTPHVRQLVLLPTVQNIAFQPGQWVSLKLPIGAKPPLNRAYSMAAPGTPSGELTLIFDRVPGGVGSNYLYTLKPGDNTQLSGPYGNFTLPMPTRSRIDPDRPVHRSRSHPLHVEASLCAATDGHRSPHCRCALRRKNCSFIRSCSHWP